LRRKNECRTQAHQGPAGGRNGLARLAQGKAQTDAGQARSGRRRFQVKETIRDVHVAGDGWPTAQLAVAEITPWRLKVLNM
jgi:hypothetical protein